MHGIARTSHERGCAPMGCARPMEHPSPSLPLTIAAGAVEVVAAVPSVGARGADWRRGPAIGRAATIDIGFALVLNSVAAPGRAYLVADAGPTQPTDAIGIDAARFAVGARRAGVAAAIYV